MCSHAATQQGSHGGVAVGPRRCPVPPSSPAWLLLLPQSLLKPQIHAAPAAKLNFPVQPSPPAAPPRLALMLFRDLTLIFTGASLRVNVQLCTSAQRVGWGFFSQLSVFFSIIWTKACSGEGSRVFPAQRGPRGSGSRMERREPVLGGAAQHRSYTAVLLQGVFGWFRERC